MMNATNQTLEMFFDEPVFEWSPTHIAFLKTQWVKFGRGSKLWEFNYSYHKSLLRNQTDATLLYRAGLEIPFYSDMAHEVAVERGLIK
jgi:hypothetical protein